MPSSTPLGPLGRRLLAGLLLASLVPMVALTALAYRQGRAAVTELARENVQKTAHLYAAELDTFLEAQRELLRALTASGARQPAELSEAVARSPHLRGLVRLGADGQVLAASSPEDLTDGWTLASCRSFLTEPASAMTHAGEAHAHEVVAAVPADDGVLCARVSFTVHEDLMNERVQGVLGGTAYIVDRQGRLVCHAFDDDEPHPERGAPIEGPAHEVARRGVAWSGVDTGRGGERSLLAFAPATTLPWGVWVEVPVATTTAALRPLVLQSVALTLALGGALALAGVALARRLTRPLHELLHAARAITEGRYGETLPSARADEIGALSAEFNRMSQALSASYAELDDRVAQRTAELRAVQARLVHQEKMAAVGTLASGLAHEIGNPLASLSSELELLERHWDADDARASLPVLRDQVRRMSELLRELMDFGRAQEHPVARTDLALLLEDASRLLRHDPRSRGVSVVVYVGEPLPALITSRDRLLQVLVNLGLNALDALGGVGTVRLSGRPDAEGAVLEVWDDGPGMSADQAAHAFEPFYTTKAPGAGTGLGLFVSERIVDQLGGRLTLHSAPGDGTRCALHLPPKPPGAQP